MSYSPSDSGKPESKLIRCPSKAQRAGFTRIELLIVIAVAGALGTVNFRAGAFVGPKAQEMQCFKNLRELSRASLAYIDENKRPIPYENPATPGGAWMGTLGGLLKNQKVMICPSAPLVEPAPLGGNRRGSADQAWVRWTEDGKTMFSGSYGYNAWLYSDPVYLRKYFPASQEQPFVFRDVQSIQKPMLTPIFVDANWVDLSPRETDLRWHDLAAGARFGTGHDNHMGRCLIARHGDKPASEGPGELAPDEKMSGNISVGFADGHVESVQLESLWNLTWHREWKPSPTPPE